MKMQTYIRNQHVFKQNDKSLYFYMVVEGEFQISRQHLNVKNGPPPVQAKDMFPKK